jgi:hypothetical protein
MCDMRHDARLDLRLPRPCAREKAAGSGAEMMEGRLDDPSPAAPKKAPPVGEAGPVTWGAERRGPPPATHAIQSAGHGSPDCHQKFWMCLSSNGAKRTAYRGFACRGRQHHQHRTGCKFHMSPNGRRDIIAGLASVERSHFLDNRRREFAFIQRAGRYGNIKPCARSRYEAAFCALSQINLRFRRAPVVRSGDLLPPSPPAEKAPAKLWRAILQSASQLASLLDSRSDMPFARLFPFGVIKQQVSGASFSEISSHALLG